MMPSSSTTVLGNMMGKVNEGMCVCQEGHWNISEVGDGGDNFLVSLKIL